MVSTFCRADSLFEYEVSYWDPVLEIVLEIAVLLLLPVAEMLVVLALRMMMRASSQMVHCTVRASFLIMHCNGVHIRT